jgi:hypothetical protein
MLQTHMHRKFRASSHPFFIDQTNHPVQKKEITVVDEIIELRTKILQFDRGTHFVDHVKGYVKEHIQFLQRKMFGALFSIGARCKFHKPDEDNDEVMGVNPVTDGT